MIVSNIRASVFDAYPFLKWSPLWWEASQRIQCSQIRFQQPRSGVNACQYSELTVSEAAGVAVAEK